MTTVLALVAFLEMVLYTKRGCLLKALFFSVLGAVLAWLLLPKAGFVLPLTKESAVICILLGLPGALLLCLTQLLLPLL